MPKLRGNKGRGRGWSTNNSSSSSHHRLGQGAVLQVRVLREQQGRVLLREVVQHRPKQLLCCHLRQPLRCRHRVQDYLAAPQLLEAS
jgi:hypothetical protein